MFGNNSDIFITNAGDVGIGTQSPSAKLDVVGKTKLNGDVEIISTNTTERTE